MYHAILYHTALHYITLHHIMLYYVMLLFIMLYDIHHIFEMPSISLWTLKHTVQVYLRVGWTQLLMSKGYAVYCGHTVHVRCIPCM